MIAGPYGIKGTLNRVVDLDPKGLQLRRDTSIALPVSLDEAKNFLRVGHDDDDEYITTLIRAMTWRIEDKAEIALSTQTLTAEWMWVNSYVWLPRPPFAAISGVTAYDEYNNTTVITSSGYYVDGLTSIRVRFKEPQYRRIRIEYSAGYGTASDIPDDLKQYILQLVYQEYNQRGSVTEDMIEMVADNFRSFFFV